MTNKQKAFTAEYLKDFNATQSAIRAGYSEQSAYKSGYENLKNKEVRDTIKLYIDESIAATKLSLQKEVLDKLYAIAMGPADVQYDKDGEIITVSRRDALRALELLGKHMTMFTEKGEHGGTIGLYGNLTDDEAKARIALLEAGS